VALTDDQRAMLRLLAQRGEEGYEDIAALMGITVDEVRQRVKEALVEVAEPEVAPEAPEPPPTPPPPPSPAAEPPQPVAEEPPAPEPARPTPEPVAVAKAPPLGSAATAKQRPKLPGVKLPKDRGALIGLGAGTLVVVIFVIVLIIGGGGSSDTASTESSEAGSTPTASENANLTQAVLSPVDGSDASGTALFGRFKKNVLLQVTAQGLEPSQSGQSYAIWLSHSGKAMVPVGTAKAPDSGDLAARFQIPAAVLVLVARSAFNEIDVTRTTDATLSAAIAKARQSKSESAYTGTDVMGGKITGPFVGAAKK
jgi:outer membrane biosynthesis protein TonB